MAMFATKNEIKSEPQKIDGIPNVKWHLVISRNQTYPDDSWRFKIVVDDARVGCIIYYHLYCNKSSYYSK